MGGGSAGGGKSYLGSVWLISSCIRFSNIRAVVARKTLKSLKESTWNTIKTILKDWDLKEEVNYKINNVEGTLTFWNDSVVIMKEMADIPSDPNFERFGSSEYTIALVDEVSEISEKAIEVLFSRLRWRTHETFKTSRMLMTTNPTMNWVRSRFVQDENGDKVVCRDGEAYIPFSVFDNPNIAFRQTYEAALNKIRNPATKERLLFGNWDFIEANDMVIYNQFSGSKHLIAGLKEKVYDPTKPLITIWDFNVAPYMSTLLAQIDYDKKKVYILEEVLGKADKKGNNTPALSRKLQKKLYRMKHVGGINVSGDPAGLQRSTANEDGVNNFTIIADILGKGVLRPKIQLLKKQPPQITRCEFVNEIFNGYNGWEVLIDIRCRKLTVDLLYQLKNEDDTKNKPKVVDPKTGVKSEKYGHLSDCLDYLLCYYLRDSWHKFKCGDDNGNILTTATINEGFNYQLMYRRFLNNNDYLSIITSEALTQITRNNTERLVQAEESAEISIIEYLSENYMIEQELNKGKYIAGYDRQITYPVGAHIYFDGCIHEVIQSINGYKKPALYEYWQEYIVNGSDTNPIGKYSQFNTYYDGDIVMYNNIAYICLKSNGYKFRNIQIPMVNAWPEAIYSEWQPIQYVLWDLVKYEGAFYTLTSLEDFDNNTEPCNSENWEEIAEYTEDYNEYELSSHEYVVYGGKVFYPELYPNSDVPDIGKNISPHDPRNYNLKKHLTRLALYELTKLIAPNNVSAIRIRDYEDSMKWLNDASKLRLNPQIPRRLAEDNKPVMDW